MRNLDKLRNGTEVLAFLCDNLVHGPGSYEGEPFRPAGWQSEFVHALYDPRRADGSRLIDRAVLLTPKGAGKTELAGALSIVELVVRDSAEVVIAAASWHQVGLLKASADGCCSHPSSNLAGLVEVTEAEIRLRNTSSRVVRVASDAGSNDGLRPTAVIFDEVHEFVTPQRERNHLVLSNGLAKRGGLALDISTVGADRETTLLGRLAVYCQRVAAGELHNDRLVYRCYSAEGLEVDLDTDEGLRAAIIEANPSARGPEPFVDVEEVMRRFREVPRGEGKRYFLNVWGDGGSEQWLPEGAWAPLVDLGRVVPKGAPVWAGFDGSYNSDSTALVMLAADRAPAHAVTLGVWERPDNAPESWVVPRDEVHAAVAAMFEDYDVCGFFCDPWAWWDELREWTRLYGEERVVALKTNMVEKFGEACSGVYAAVVNKELSHDGNEVLARHLRHAVPRQVGTKRTTIEKVHRASTRRIDAAVALALAHYAMGDLQPEEPSIYEERGLIVL